MATDFKYYIKNCLNFKETSDSYDIEKPWSERCGNFYKDRYYDPMNTCWNCANKKINED